IGGRIGADQQNIRAVNLIKSINGVVPKADVLRTINEPDAGYVGIAACEDVVMDVGVVAGDPHPFVSSAENEVVAEFAGDIADGPRTVTHNIVLNNDVIVGRAQFEVVSLAPSAVVDVM